MGLIEYLLKFFFRDLESLSEMVKLRYFFVQFERPPVVEDKPDRPDTSLRFFYRLYYDDGPILPFPL